MSPVLSLAPGLSWEQPLLGERRQSVSVHPYSKTNRNQLDRWAQGATLLAIAVSVNRLVNRQYAMYDTESRSRDHECMRSGAA